jgi:hypothetical protein
MSPVLKYKGLMSDDYATKDGFLDLSGTDKAG